MNSKVKINLRPEFFPDSEAGVRGHDDFQASDSRVAIYVRLARVMREKIIGGTWKAGQRLPTVHDLAKQFQVAAVTIRQAYALLVTEGLITSTRGRGTFVTTNPRFAHDDPDFRKAINDPFELAPGQTMHILEKRRVRELPPEFAAPKGRGDYVHLRKVHAHHGRPFVLLDVYVLYEIFNKFPRGAEEKSKIMALLRDYSGKRKIAVSRQEVTIGHADSAISHSLQYTMGASLVRLRSWRWDANNEIVYVGVNHYRGDSFVLDYTQRLENGGELRPWLTPLPAS